MIEDSLDTKTKDGRMKTFDCHPEHDDLALLQRSCYDKPAVERHRERLFSLYRRKLGG